MKKISGKIFAVIMCCSCLSVLLLGNVSIFSGSRSLRKISEEQLSWMVREYASGFSHELLLIEDKVRDMEQHIRDTIDVAALRSDPDYLSAYEQELAEYLENFATTRTGGRSAWCYFNPELSESSHDVYFADQNGDGIPERQDHIPPEYYDNTPTPTDDKQWWYGAVESDNGFWTNPYEWTLKNGTVIKVVSHARSVYIDGELIAVVGTYYPFGEMGDEIRGIRVYDTGYASLFNEKLDVIIHPTLSTGTRFTSDNLKTTADGFYSRLTEQIAANDYGIYTYTSPEGKRSIFAYSRLTNGWVLGLSPRIDEMLADNYRLVIKLVAAAVICVLLSLAAAWFMGRRLSRPLMKVVEGARRIGAGDLSTPVVVNTKDEMQVVACSLNEMMDSTKRLQGELLTLAYTDELTGGSNLNKFKQLAEMCLCSSNRETYYLIRLDVDSFKLINDMFGFAEGNNVLMNIHNAIASLLSPDEYSGRISNDDFIMLVQRNSDEEIIELGHRFLDCFNDLNRVSGHSYNVNFAVGIYKVPREELNIVTIIDRCTMAHKTAKLHSSGKNYAFYNAQIRDNALKVKSIEDNMYAALQNGEFVIYLQPKYDLNTLKIKGAEALVRWINPVESRVIPPMEFIPIFERNGFVANIDLFVLESVCKLLREWLDEGLSPVPISVNQSKILLFDSDYISKITAVVDRYGVPHHLVELEILETLIHYNSDLLQSIVATLKELDFLVSIDDFGSGYSSLNMLKDIPADVLKIDKEFLNNSEDNKRSEIVLSNIIKLARDLHMSVVTEGVETQKQAIMLRDLNCDTAQGYLFARPMSVSDYNKLIH